MAIRYLFITGLFCFFSTAALAQSPDSLLQKLEQIPDNFYHKIEQKYTSLNQKLSRKTLQYLKRLEQQEKKWYQKLVAFDPSFKGKQNENIHKKYAELTDLLAGKKEMLTDVNLTQYSAYMDTLSTSLSFLQQYADYGDKIKISLEELNQLKSSLNISEKIKAFIAERKEQLKGELAKYSHLPNSLKKEYEQLGKTIYYYNAQLQEYKQMLGDPDKTEKKAIELLNGIPAFQKFMRENSQLASLFRLPGNNLNGVSLNGLQTRQSVQQIIQQEISSGGPNAMMQVQQQLSEAHSQINQMKDRLNEMANGGSGDADLPDFKPNQQKTKTFLKRLEYGFDIQFGKSTSLLPSSANMGLSVGYKLNDKSIIGIGGSYKMGIGSIEHVSITHQGLGIRSFLDWKAPFGSKGVLGGLWFSGGYEMNYNASFKNIEQLKNELAWQKSALIGLSKKYKISNKVKGEMKILYDFLANSHFPETSPLVFRLGYKF